MLIIIVNQQQPILAEEDNQLSENIADETKFEASNTADKIESKIKTGIFYNINNASLWSF